MKVENRSFSKVLVIGLVVAGLIIGSIFFLQDGLEAENIENDIDRAVIIDQLHGDLQNLYFTEKATEYLESAGYQVDVVRAENVTVDFYKQLPKMNYKYIVLRSHAVAQSIDNPVALFTGEMYTEDKYIQEQLFGQVLKGAPLRDILYNATIDTQDWEVVNSTYRTITFPANPEDAERDDFFLISPKLVKENMKGTFPGSIILLGGCSTLKNPSMAEALVAKGASTIIGWDDLVGSYDNDSGMLKMLKELLVNNLEPEEAIEKVSGIHVQNPKWSATLKLYTDKNI